MKREIEIVVLSDLHLGTYGCHAEELMNYLKSVKPLVLVLNGDIIDMWQFKKNFFPKEHLQVIHRILKMANNGTKVYYITGNHDEKLRNFADLQLSNLHLVNQLTLSIGNKKYWFFHGDVFDLSVKYSKNFAKLGALGYDSLIRLNNLVNVCRKKLGLERVSFSKMVKYKVKEAVKFIQDFEQLAIEKAAEKKYDYVVCGHIHRPIIRKETINGKSITYLNSGDWVEHLTALEYNNGKWKIYEYDEMDYNFANPKLYVPNKNEIYQEVDEFESLSDQMISIF